VPTSLCRRFAAGGVEQIDETQHSDANSDVRHAQREITEQDNEHLVEAHAKSRRERSEALDILNNAD